MPRSSVKPSRFFTAAAAVLALLGGGCAEIDATVAHRVLFQQHAPGNTLVAPGTELQEAERCASAAEDSFALLGAGESMAPVYRSGTAIVVQERDYRGLHSGEMAVYRNRRGFYVAHMLLEELRPGWLAIGLGNREPDDDLITPANFVGVVRATFTSYELQFVPMNRSASLATTFTR